jgi:phosphoribosylanthranilate isomerase
MMRLAEDAKTMEPTRRPRLKVCCIQDVEEARLAVRLGASALGLVSAMPSGPGVIAEETIAAVARIVPPPVASFLLTSQTDAAGIVEQQRRTRVSALQICDRLERGAHRHLREALPGIALVQVVHVTGPESVEEAVALAGEADAILLDSGNQSLAVKELGGTGRRHDWRLSRRIRESVPVPIFLAGGLRPENVQEAIAEVGPFALDVCSGVRTDGRLDAEKLERLMAAIAAA